MNRKPSSVIIPSEDQEQEMLFTWAGMNLGRYPELKLMFAVPNGAFRHIQTAVKLKSTGVKAGVPDIFLPVARQGCNGMFIEMKRQKNGKVSAYQKIWIDDLMHQGYYVVIAHGFEQAKQYIERYLQDK